MVITQRTAGALLMVTVASTCAGSDAPHSKPDVASNGPLSETISVSCLRDCVYVRACDCACVCVRVCECECKCECVCMCEM